MNFNQKNNVSSTTLHNEKSPFMSGSTNKEVSPSSPEKTHLNSENGANSLTTSNQCSKSLYINMKRFFQGRGGF